MPRILTFAGSTRRDSFNKKLARLAARAAQAAGADVTLLDLRDYPLPLFDQDLETESGLPDNAQRLKKIFIDHNALLIASPEYNSSITAVLKNTIDWVSRPVPGEPPLRPFVGKVAALLSASPGALGGLRGLVHLRSILGNIGVFVLPDQVAIMKANDAFEPDGSLKDPKFKAAVDEISRKLADVTKKLIG